ncbi:MAG: type II secretion system secretin GspD, partial [Alphaproteobacteria bacterium]
MTRLFFSLGMAVLLTACEDFKVVIEPDEPAEQVAEAPAAAAGTGAPAVVEAGQLAPPAAGAAPRKPGVYPGTGRFIKRRAAARPPVGFTAEGDVTLNFADADVREVVRTILGDILKVNYIIDPKVEGTITVQTSRPLARSFLLSTLESILRVNGAVLVREGEVYRVVPWKGALTGSAPLRLRARPGAREPGFGVEIVPLRYIAAAEMEKILISFAPKESILKADPARNLLILAGTRAERATLLDAIELFDVDWLSGMSFALFPLQNANVKDLTGELEKVFGKEGETPLGGLVRFVPVERLNAVMVISPQPAYLEQARVWVERLDQSADATSPRVYVYYVQNGRAADLAAVLNDIFGGRRAPEAPVRLAPGREPVTLRAEAAAPRARAGAPTRRTGHGMVPQRKAPAREPRAAPASAAPPPAPGEGITLAGEAEIRIIADEATNALVILATPADYRMVEAALKKLDIVPLQVLIEATIAEVTLTDDLRYGLQWFFKSGNFSATLSEVDTGDAAQFFPGFSVLFATTDISVVLNALEGVTDINIISSPQLMVLDNQTARLQVGDQVPIVRRTAVRAPVEDGEVEVDSVTLTNEVELLDTGVILNVTPRVNAGGLVIMEIEQEVSDAVATITSGIDSPTIRQRKITST